MVNGSAIGLYFEKGCEWVQDGFQDSAVTSNGFQIAFSRFISRCFRTAKLTHLLLVSCLGYLSQFDSLRRRFSQCFIFKERYKLSNRPQCVNPLSQLILDRAFR